MLFGVLLGRVIVVLLGMQMMTMRDFGVMRGLLVVAALVMLGRLTMMFRRLFVMMRGFFVMLVDVVLSHFCLPDGYVWGLRSFAGEDDKRATLLTTNTFPPDLGTKLLTCRADILAGVCFTGAVFCRNDLHGRRRGWSRSPSPVAAEVPS